MATDVQSTVNSFHGRRAALPITVGIVGGGIGGLTTAIAMTRAGHRVKVFEQLESFEEASRGSGVSIQPNFSRILISWGLGEKLRACSSRPTAFRLLKHTGASLSYHRLEGVVDYDYGAPLLFTTRPELYTLLYNAAISAPSVEIRYNSAVKSIDPHTPMVHLASGEVIQVDLVIGAEGAMDNMIRETVQGLNENGLLATDQSISHTLIPVSLLEENEELRPLLDELTIWGGQGKIIVAYRAGPKFYNVSFQYPDPGNATQSYEALVDMALLRKAFEASEPRIQTLLQLTTYASFCAIVDHPSNPTWVHESGKVALLGDACHPSVPPRKHGASLAGGDAVALGSLFSRLSAISQIPFLLRAYVEIREPPCTKTQDAARLTCVVLTQSDEQQHKANLEFQDQTLPESERSKKPGEWSFWRREEETYSTDAEEDAEEWWRMWGHGVNDMGIKVRMQVDAVFEG